MNLTHANNHSRTLHGRELGMGLMALGAAWCLVVASLVLAGLAGYSQMDVAIAFFVLVTSAGAGALGFWQAHSIAEASRVMGARAAPCQLWQHWWASSTKQGASLWGAMALGLMLVMLPTASPGFWLTPVAIVSAVQALCMVLALAMNGLLQRVWLWGLALSGLALLALSALVGGVVSTFQCFDVLPALALLALAIAWPVLIATLTRLWPGVPQLAQSHATVLTLPGLFQAYQRRYVPIDVGGVLGGTLLVVALSLLANRPIKPTELAWGDQVTGLHLLCQILLVMVCSRHLVCKDLHWRGLLAPGYLRGGRIGTRIVRGSLETAGGLVLTAAALILSLEWLQSGFSVASVLDAASRYCLLPVQVIFAVCIATLIRGAWPELNWEPPVAAMALAAAAAFTTFNAAGADAWTNTLFEAGFAYTCSLLALSAVALGLANRLWTIPKLAKFTAQN